MNTPEWLDVDSRAQIGAATILILIAAMVVAASTASVLYNTTGFLQSEAETTGEAVEHKISDSIRIVAVNGRINQTADTPYLNHTRVVVARQAMSPIDLKEATVRIRTPNGTESLVYDQQKLVRDETFIVEPIINSNPPPHVLSDDEDRLAIVAETPPLRAGDQVSFQISLQSGASKSVTVEVPRGIDDERSIFL